MKPIPFYHIRTMFSIEFHRIYALKYIKAQTNLILQQKR
jgi:hypothetical protein